MRKFYAFIVATMLAAVSFAQGGRAPHLRAPFALPTMSKALAVQPLQRQSAKPAMRKAEAASANYVRVTTAPADWAGQYLIVYEENGLAMNGGLADQMDAQNNSIAVTIADQEIEANEATDAASFTISADAEGAYSIRNQGGFSIGWTTEGKNGLQSVADPTLTNQLSIDNEGNAVIYAQGDAYLRYNAAQNQLRFRYYKSATAGNQQPVALYKKGGEKTELPTPELIQLPEGVEPEPYTMSATMYYAGDDDWELESIYETVMVAFDGQDVYVQGLSFWFPEAWAKGTIDGDKVVFESNQFMGEDEYGPDYLMACVFGGDNGFLPADQLIFDYNADTRTLTINSENFYAETETPNGTGLFSYCMDLTLTPGEAVEFEQVELPEGLVPVQYMMTATAVVEADEEDEAEEENAEAESETDTEFQPVFLAFDGNDVYVQGLDIMLPDAWVKGTREGNVITLPAGQYFGTFESFLSSFPMFLAATSETGEMEDLRFTISEDDNVLTAQNQMVISGTANTLRPYVTYSDAVLVRTVEVAATPVAPEIESFEPYDDMYGYGMLELIIPYVGTEGEALLADKLSYVIYTDEDGTVSPYTFTVADYPGMSEDMTEVPMKYNDEDYISSSGNYITICVGTSTETFKRIGAQTIYRGLGQEKRSEITWYDIVDDSDALQRVTTDLQSGSNAIFDLSGRRVAKPGKGLYIVNGKKMVVK